MNYIVLDKNVDGFSALVLWLNDSDITADSLRHLANDKDVLIDLILINGEIDEARFIAFDPEATCIEDEFYEVASSIAKSISDEYLRNHTDVIRQANLKPALKQTIIEALKNNF